GLSEEEALKLITLNPASQLGVESRVGSIEVGKDADLAVWSGHPLSVYSRAEMTMIDGETFFDRRQDIARRPELERERRQLEQLEANRPPVQGGTTPPAPRDRRPTSAHDDDLLDEGDGH
ncbi:MAG: amidohydrolase family protein, partial [Acidobacteriota bacterium]|nr:amidohydrolase family protein [Acidobacteriota bacterium]